MGCACASNYRGRVAEEEAPDEVFPVSKAGLRGIFVFLISDTFAKCSVCFEATVDSSGQSWRTALGFVLAWPLQYSPGSPVTAATLPPAPPCSLRWAGEAGVVGVRASAHPSPALGAAGAGLTVATGFRFFSQRSLKHASPLRLHAAGPLSPQRGTGWQGGGCVGGVALNRG